VITEHDDTLIDRYLNRRMDAAESTAFEIRLMDEPLLLERVQLIDAMKQGLQTLPPADTRSAHRAKVLPFPQWLRQPLSMAASVVIAALLLRNILMPPAAPTAGSGIGTVLLMESNRGTAVPQFHGAPPYLLQLDVGLGNNADSYDFTLTSNGNAQLNLVGLQADVDGWVRVVVSEALTGDYQAELAWTGADGTAVRREYPFSVTR
jgi:hypothetical protein